MTLNSNDKSLNEEHNSSNNKLNDFQLIKEISNNDNLIDNTVDNLVDNSNDKSIDNNLNENLNNCSSTSTEIEINSSLDNQISSKNDLINENKDDLIINKDQMETNICTSLDEDVEMTINEIEKSPNKKKDLESPKKRIKLTPKKDKLSPLIRQPKLQINDKTMKKLKSDTDDLIFNNTITDNQSTNNTKYTTTDQKLKNNLLVPVVSNVLSRSIAAIFCNSTINKNGEFNSYSALGFNNKGPRVKRVCRSFNDVYRGLPRAVFPINNSSATETTTTTKSLPSANKSNKSTNSPNKRQNKKNLIKQSSASTSNSNSSFKIEDDLETECSYDSDDLDISEYIARNLKKEMQSSKDVC